MQPGAHQTSPTSHAHLARHRIETPAPRAMEARDLKSRPLPPPRAVPPTGRTPVRRTSRCAHTATAGGLARELARRSRTACMRRQNSMSTVALEAMGKLRDAPAPPLTTGPHHDKTRRRRSLRRPRERCAMCSPPESGAAPSTNEDTMTDGHTGVVCPVLKKTAYLPSVLRVMATAKQSRHPRPR